jgi:hypothetical protein
LRRFELLACFGLLAAAGCGSESPTNASGVTALQIVDLRVGTGDEAVGGVLATVE